jgi:hypothetical protein
MRSFCSRISQAGFDGGAGERRAREPPILTWWRRRSPERRVKSVVESGEGLPVDVAGLGEVGLLLKSIHLNAEG